MARPALAALTTKDRPNIILLSLDTTRADHMSCYGYFRDTTPELDKIAEESVFYTRAVSPSSPRAVASLDRGSRIRAAIMATTNVR